MSESTTRSAALPDSDAQDARTRVAERYRLLAEGDRQEAWITLRPEAEVAEELEAVLARVGAGEQLPLAGLLFAVKNNIDVAGIDTTAACPAFAYAPEEDATTVARLRAAGAVVLGATNLDQFATGLVGSRSPYGAVRHAVHPEAHLRRVQQRIRCRRGARRGRLRPRHRHGGVRAGARRVPWPVRREADQGLGSGRRRGARLPQPGRGDGDGARPRPRAAGDARDGGRRPTRSAVPGGAGRARSRAARLSAPRFPSALRCPSALSSLRARLQPTRSLSLSKGASTTAAPNRAP